MKDIIALNICQMQYLEKLGIDISKARLELMLHPSFLLQDIIELLPKEIKTSTDTYWLTISIYDCKEWYVCYSMSDEFDYYKEFKSVSLLEASYQMLCWCAENGYLKGGEK